MVSTVPLSELEKFADNIYEAIVIIAKRARQINQEQKKLLEREMEIEDENEEYEEADEETEKKEVPEKKYLRLPKPTSIALDEMLAGKLRSEYLEEKEDNAEK